METVLSNVGKEGKGVKGSTFGNTNRKDADMPVSAVEHLLTKWQLGTIAMSQKAKMSLIY